GPVVHEPDLDLFAPGARDPDMAVAPIPERAAPQVFLADVVAAAIADAPIDDEDLAMIPIVETGNPREKVGELHAATREQRFELPHRPSSQRIEEQSHLDAGLRLGRDGFTDFLGSRLVPPDVLLEVAVLYPATVRADRR